MNRWLLRLLPLGLIALAPIRVTASVPDPTRCVLDPCIVFCPEGHLAFHVVVKDLAGNVVAGSFVTLDLSHCGAFAHCPTVLVPYTTNDASRTISAVSNVNGVASFPVRMGGVCRNLNVQIFADGVFLGMRSLASPDQNGDLVVDAQDLVLAQALVGTTDPAGDLNCDGSVSAADVTIVENHLFHTCPVVTGTPRTSWGTLKIRYR